MKELVIPSSRDAEAYVLGSMLVENRLALEYYTRLSTEDFYFKENQHVYKAIYNLCKNNRTVDAVSVNEELKKLQLSEAVGGIDYLFTLIEGIPSIINAEVYVETIEEKSIERKLYYEAQKISKEVLEGTKDFGELLARSEKGIIDIVNRQRTAELVPIDQVSEEIISIIEKNRSTVNKDLLGLDTGFDTLNKYTHGFKPGELIILAARPAIGKSALALNLATNACENSDASVAIFSLEMSTDQLVMRMLSNLANVPLEKTLKGELDETDMAKVLVAKKKLDSFKLYIDDTTTCNIEEIKIKCRKQKRNGKLDFIVIDYLQLLTGKREGTRTEVVSELSRGLKLLARELQVPILALSQLSRAVEQRKNAMATSESGKPMLSDLRESGSIEQDADMVLMLHRGDSQPDELKIRSKKTELIIAKNRQGMTGSINLQFSGEYARFVENKKIEKD